jgi:hypothetical protein
MQRNGYKIEQGADLKYADLRDADLRNADLRNADLRGADLRNADLRGADLKYADLRDADLTGTKIRFPFFPSVTFLGSIPLFELSDKLTLELMRRDAYGHPSPERFDVWAKGGKCPYRNEQRAWRFCENRKVWRKGKPQMADRDLVEAICEEKGWEIAR